MPNGPATEAGRKSPWGRARRVLVIVAIALVGGEAFYLVAMNVFLSTSLFERFIDATPDVVDIHYTRGWSLLPTRVHAKNLSIRATDSHVEWILRFDDVEFDCSLLDLARHREFHANWARGSGITFRARLKAESPGATREYLRDLPTIDSLGPLAFVPSDPPYPGMWDDEKWHLWTVRIDDAIAEHVREVWVQGGRLHGDARVAGSFYLKPMRAAEVGPAHVEIRSGSVALGGRTIAEPLAATFDFKLDRFDPRTAAMTDIVHHVTLALDAATTVPDLDNLSLTLPDAGQIRGEVDVPRLAVRIAKGVLGDDSRVEAHAKNVTATTAAHVVSGDLEATARVTGGKLAATLSLRSVEADFALRVPAATVSVDSAALDLGDAFGDLHGVVDVADAELASAARLADYLPKSVPLKILGGDLGASLHAEGWRATRRARGTLAVRAARLEVAGGAVHAKGDARLDASVAELDVGKKTLVSSGGSLTGEVALVLENVEGGVDPGPRGAFSVGHIEAHVASKGLSLRRPSIGAVDYRLRVRGGELHDARALGALLPPGGTFAIESGRVRLSADLASSAGEAVARGEIDLSLVNGGIRLDRTRLTGDVSVEAPLRNIGEVGRHRAELDLQGAHIALRNVRVTGASTDVAAWNGDVALSCGVLALSDEPRFDGCVGLNARDASPILAVLFRDTLPKVLAPLATMPSFAARMRVTVQPEEIVLSDLDAGGGDLAVKGTYAVHGSDAQGAFIVHKGPLAVGINIDGAGAHVRLFGLDDWYGDLSRQALAPR